MKALYQYKRFYSSNGLKSVKDLDEKRGIITGYFAAFNNVDLGKDMIEPAAFNKTVAERGPEGSNDIFFLNQHDTWQTLGKPTVLRPDNYGLYHESPVSNTTLGKDTMILVRDGVLDKFSIGYRTINEQRDGEINRLKEIFLYEGSLVTFPMNEQAILTGIKGMGVEQAAKRIKQLEKWCFDTEASDDTIKLLLLHIKQMQQVLIDLQSTEPPKDTPPEMPVKNDAAETLIREVNNMRIANDINQFIKTLR